MCHLIVGQVGIKIITLRGIKPVVENMPQPTWKDQFYKKKYKLDKSSNFAVNAKHVTEEQSQSQSCFESQVDEGFQLIDLSFLIEQLRRGCCTCKTITNLKP